MKTSKNSNLSAASKFEKTDSLPTITFLQKNDTFCDDNEELECIKSKAKEHTRTSFKTDKARVNLRSDSHLTPLKSVPADASEKSFKHPLQLLA